MMTCQKLKHQLACTMFFECMVPKLHIFEKINDPLRRNPRKIRPPQKKF